MTIGEKIKFLRKKSKDTQGSFSVKLDIPRGTLAAVEYDNATPPFPMLLKLHEVFGISIDWLLFDLGSMYLDAKEDKSLPLLKEFLNAPKPDPRMKVFANFLSKAEPADIKLVISMIESLLKKSD